MSPRRVLRPILLLVGTLLGAEATAWLVILATRPFMTEPIGTRAGFYSAQTDAVRRFLAGDRDIWVFDSTAGWRTSEKAMGPKGEYARTPPPGVRRMLAFGNSFMRGAEVPLEKTWLNQVEARFPEFETLNFAFAGYGVDQAYLVYLEERANWEAETVLIGLAPDNLRRNVNVYRRFLTPHGPPLTKPRFRLASGGRLELFQNPLRRVEDLSRLLETPQMVTRWGQLDAWYDATKFENPLYDWSASIRLAAAVRDRLKRRFSRDRETRGGAANPASEGFALQVALTRQFVQTVVEDGKQPIIVLMPDRFSVERSLAGKPAFLDPVVAEIRKDGTRVIDLGEPLAAAARAGVPLDSLFTSGLHYSVAAGSRIAEWLGPVLVAAVPTPR